MMQATKSDLSGLATALRDVVLTVRRRAPGDGPDRGAVMLLVHVLEHGPTRATTLAENVFLDPSTVSRHIRSLEASGLLIRTPDPEDGRATLLKVSTKGRALVTEARKDRIAMLQDAVAHWSEKDVHLLTTLTRRLAEDLERK